MSRRRQPSTPPDLPGYSYSRLLGMGGFADVFLYQQELPSRDVAVKVLLDTHLDDEARAQFVTEANLMAQVSQHPAIVTVHHAGFADDGRPYLVMEYCSRPGVAERYRAEKMDVAESLRIAIRIASAVASAHEAGIWHRDIKPANVLTTDYGWPALTDFGIAATAAIAGSAVGMSIPWAPPELLSPSPSGDERSDVYALAATLYSMLAGRSPFEVLGTANTAGDLVGRIERMPLPRITRQDMPDELFEVLDTAMSKRSEDRHPSVVAFARDLQAIEADLGLPVTGLDLVEIPSEPVGRSTVSKRRIERTAPEVTSIVEPDELKDEPSDRVAKVRIIHTPPEVEVLADPEPKPVREPRPESQAPRRTERNIALAAIGALVFVIGAVGVGAVLGQTSAGGQPVTTTYYTPPPVHDVVVPAPQDVEATVSGATATFTWTNPQPAEGDQYRWKLVERDGSTGQVAVVHEESVTVEAAAGQQVCIEVEILRSNGQISATPARGCTS